MNSMVLAYVRLLLQQHILSFAINLYNYILVKKDICD
jgi:hypothetical protein